MGKRSKLFKKYYKDYPAGGFLYKNLIHENCCEGQLILDFGAGRGVNNKKIPKAVIAYGVDVDECIYQNQRLKEKKVIKNDEIPYPDNHFDLVMATWVVEHLPDPVKSFSEIRRVLKPKGKFIFLTTSRFHYVSLIAALTPQSFHEFIIPKISNRIPDDVYPTVYKVNTEKAIKEVVRLSGFKIEEVILREPPPAYLAFSNFTFHIGRLYQKLVTRFDTLKVFRHEIIGVLSKT